MKGADGPPILAVLVILLSGHWVASLNPCPALPVSPTYCSTVNSTEVNATLQSDDWCGRALPLYACALGPNVTSSQLFSILQCYITDPAAQLDQDAFLLLFQTVSREVLQAALNEISIQIPSAQITPASRVFLLKAAWEVLKTDPRVQNAGFLASWLQETLHAYLTAVDTNILDCMAQLPITCDGLATVVQALDSVYPRMDNSTRQLVATWIKRFLMLYTCPENTAKEWILSNWKSFLSYASYHELTLSWSRFDGFAALDVLTASQLAQLTADRNVFSNRSLAAGVIQVLGASDVLFLDAYLTELSTFVLSPPLDREVLYSVLETVLLKVNESFPDLCSPSLKDLFQVKLKMLLTVADARILSLIPTKIGCADFQEIYRGLNSVHSQLDPETQQAVYEARLNFLNGQVAKEGVACTFTAATSQDWLQDNFGFSSVYADYSDLIWLNPSFNGYEVMDLLTAVQLGKLAVVSNLLTNGTRVSAEADAATLMHVLGGRNISELQRFLHELNKPAGEVDIVSVANVRVRDVMLKGIFQILKPSVASMTTTDVDLWFGGILTLFLPSITADELMDLTAITNCTQLPTMVKGLDYAFDQMTTETKTGVTQWIVEVLLHLDCRMPENWMALYFRRFQTTANLTDFIAINKNFTGMEYLRVLTPVQLAQLTLTQDVFSSVTNTELVFARLAETPGLEGLALYWDEFNLVFEKPVASALNISMEVRRAMLARTMGQLRLELPTFTDHDYHLWFEKKLVGVLPSVRAEDLREIPTNLSCGSYKSIIAGLSTGFSDMPEAGKMDVCHYIVSFLTQKSQVTGPACYAQTAPRDWLLGFFGHFSAEIPYAQLVALSHQPFDAYMVLDILTPPQIGDMVVHSDTLSRVDLATQLVQFFQESKPEDVQMILVAFTRAAVMRKVTVLPSDDITRLLLLTYLTVMSGPMETYTAADWNATLQNEMRFLIPVIDATTLAFIVPQDYDTLVAVVAGLDGGYGYMTESSRRAVVLWIVQNLKLLKAHPAGPITEWIPVTWRSFFFDATLEEVKATYESFDPASVLGFLSTGQLLEYAVTSDALYNVTAMRTVLRSLAGEDSAIPLSKMDAFLMEFNIAIAQMGSTGILNAGVRAEMLTTLFLNLSNYFYKFTDLNYQVWFLERLKFLLPSINADLLDLIPVDISFPSYTTVVRGLDNVFLEFPPTTARDIYLSMQKILEHHRSFSDSVFPGAYHDSRSFLQVILYRFAPFATYADLHTFYQDFNGFEVLDLLSAGQIGEMMVATNALRNERLAIQILVEMETRPAAEMAEFIAGFNAAAEQMNLTVLPNPRVRDLTFETVFKSLQIGTLPAEGYDFWFGSQLRLFLPALTTYYLQQLPLDMDCRSHQSLVQAMDRAYDQYTEEQRQAIHSRILNYLETYRTSQGSTCSSDANSSTWLLSNYGRFSAYARMEEFPSLNPNFDGMLAMAVLSPAQLAQLMVAARVLANETSVLQIMNCLLAPSHLAQFFDALNPIASVELQGSEHAHLILSTALQNLAGDFPQLQASDFAYWFQVAFRNVLQTADEVIVARIPTAMSCDSYQQTLKGFNNVYASLTPANALSVFGFCSTFLTSKVKSGLACGSTTQSVQNWLDINLGNFSKYAAYRDLLAWNQHFDGMVVLDRLSPGQLASLTLVSDAINDDEEMCQVLARLQDKSAEEIYQYLDQLNTEAQQKMITTIKNEGVQKRMLSQFVDDLKAGFAAFSPQDWTRFFTKSLMLLLPSAGEEEIKLFLSHIPGCDSFQAMVSSLSQAYRSMSPMNRRGAYAALFAFLESQSNATGSACATDQQQSSPAWLHDNFGAFAAHAPYADFIKLKADFNGFAVRDNLTATQLAHVFFGPNALEDAARVDALVLSLQSRPVGDVTAFVTEFEAIASQQGIVSLANAQVRDAMFNAIFYTVQGQFPAFSPLQYKDWFQSKLSLWLASINASALEAIPKNVPCGVYQAIMAGLDSSFQYMSSASQRDVYSFAKEFLATKATQEGDPCLENTRGSLGWLQVNLGSFSSLASYGELVDLNADFSAVDAVAGLSPVQLATYTLASDVLRDRDKAGKVFGSLNSRTIGDFLDAFNAIAQQKHYFSQLPHADVRRFILGEIFCHLSTMFQLFTPEDYSVWLGERLPLFLSSLNAQNLGFLPSDMSCNSLAVIVKILNDYRANGTYENAEDIFSFVKRVLHFQTQNSGSACTQGVTDDRQWLLRYFGFLAAFGSYSDFTALKNDFRGQDSLDLLSASALAQLSAQSNAIYSPSAIQMVFRVVGSKEEPLNYLGTYLDEFNALVLTSSGLLGHSKVRDTMLMMAAEIVFPEVATMSLEDVSKWLNRLSILLPSVNATVLEMLPLSMPCPYYRAIIKAIGEVYLTLPARKKQDVYTFQKAYLTAQFADTDSACQEGTTGTRDWLQKNMGEFCSLAQLSELQTFYPDIAGFKVPSLETPEQMAQLTVNSTLNSLEDTLAILAILDCGSYSTLHRYMSQFNVYARQANLTSLPNALVRDALLRTVLTKLRPRLPLFPPGSWADWFQTQLTLLLPGINETYLGWLDTNPSCASYQAVVQGFNVAYESLSPSSKMAIYRGYMKPYLSQQSRTTGVACDSRADLDTWADANLGKFVQQASMQDLIGFNAGYYKAGTTDSLTPTDAGGLLPTQEAVSNAFVPRSVSTHGPSETSAQDLDRTASATAKTNLMDAEISALNVTALTDAWNKLSSNFSNFTPLDWRHFFQDNLRAMLPHMNSTHLPLMAANLTCSSHREIANALSNASVQLPQPAQDAVYQYLLAIHRGSTLKCYAGPSLQAFLDTYLAKFSTKVTTEDLVALIPSSRMSEIVGSLQPREMLDILIESGHSNNPSALEIILRNYRDIEKLGTVLDGLDQEEYRSNASMKAVLDGVWPTLVTALTSLNSSSLDTWLNKRLQAYLPLLTKNQLDVLEGFTANCADFRHLVKATNTSYSDHTAEMQGDTGTVLESSLLQQGDQLKCYNESDGNGNSTAWFQNYLTHCTGKNIHAFSNSPQQGNEMDTCMKSLQGLAPAAAGLTPSMLLGKMDGQTLRQMLPWLSATTGWSPAQASIILRRVLQGGYQVSNASRILALGELAVGLPAAVLDELGSRDILLLAADRGFSASMERAAQPIKHKFVRRILQSTNGSIFLHVPDNLADQIPLGRLASTHIDVDEVNRKRWTPMQASVFFQAVLKSTQEYSRLSSAVLQGFSCGAANFLNKQQFARLVKAMKGKQVSLEHSQLSCMTRRLKGQITELDFEEYPADLLLYMGPEEFANTATCQKYFQLVGQANVDLQPRGSSKRQSLVDSALACLGISSLSLSKENLQTLGHLACALNGSYIAKSDLQILTVLQSCRSFTGDQQAAVEEQLERKYGPPSAWTASTLIDMGAVASALRRGTLQRIPEVAKTQFFPNFLSQLKTQNRNQFTLVMEQLANAPRQKRDTNCAAPLTAEVLVEQRDFVGAKYTSGTELDACLSAEVLRDALETLGKVDFQDGPLQALKWKLDKTFGTLPEDYLPLLGNIARMYNTAEIGNWNITTADTLSALLTGTSWQNDLPKVNALVSRYLEGSGMPLDGMLLTVLAPYICALGDADIKALSSEAIREISVPMNVSQCSQRRKSLLYDLLRAAYQEHQSSPDAYYQLLRPVIGGASAQDLIRFASGHPVMATDVFMGLNPDEVQKLRPQDLKDLLGVNLPDLNHLADQPVVKAWAQSHKQSEVHSLGLHLAAGLPDPTPHGFIHIPAAPQPSGRAVTHTKDYTAQLFYCVLLHSALAVFL